MDNQQEIFPVVDADGRVVGSATRGECHSGSMLLHPVVHLHVFRSNGDIYLQRRPAWKDIQPGKWDTAVGGHLDVGETREEALRREVGEELGITDFEAEFIGKYVFESSRERELVYVHRCMYDGEIRPSTEELDGGRFWTMQEIGEAMGKGVLTPNFESEFKRFFGIGNEAAAKSRVIGIGETVLDILFKNDQPQKAVPGGSTFNSIISLGRAGVPCAMVTEVGGDHVGDLICQYLRENGVSTDYVCRHEHIKSHVSLAFLDENNDAQYIFYKDHASVSLDGRLPQIAREDVVLFGSFFAINPSIRPVVGKLLRSAREAGAWLYYDVNFRKPHIADLPVTMPNIEENMSLADVVRGSTEDFENLYGLHDGDAVYDRMRHLCQTLILTDGAGSVRLYTPEGCETYPVQSIETVSTVGAGDNFNAGYIFAKMQGIEDPADRIAMAQRWSQDVCRQMGNNISDELAACLKRHYSVNP